MLSALVRSFGCVAICRRIAESGAVFRAPSLGLVRAESRSESTLTARTAAVLSAALARMSPLAESQTIELGVVEDARGGASPHAVATKLNTVTAAPAVIREFIIGPTMQSTHRRS
jgi:hypothetical protein